LRRNFFAIQKNPSAKKKKKKFRSKNIKKKKKMISRVAAVLFLFIAIVALLINVEGVYAFYKEDGSEGVVNLTPDNFAKEVLKHKGPVLVEFYAPWCGHCKRLTPEYIKAAKALDGVTKLAAVDADKYGALGSKYGVQGFPTLLWYSQNKKSPTTYEGGRTASDIVADALSQIEKVAKSRLAK
jgi:protein disulfide-isomerase A6